MRAERLILKSDGSGKLRDIPQFPPDTQIEAIFVVLSQSEHKPRRQPIPELASVTHVQGDIISPVVDETDWNALK